MRKQIVIFANSRKHTKHCVAGKEISSGKWIRPVSDSNGAELDHSQCLYVNKYGRFPAKVLQKIEIDIVSHNPLPHQPENYLIGDGVWEQRYKIEPSEVPMFLDHPETLWGEWHKVPFASIENGSTLISQSLYLVKVENLAIHWSDSKRRAAFTYNGIHYNLPVTDPNFENQIAYPNHQEVPCVSLGERYSRDGGATYSCYKIVASII